jgi:hypothetical protein
MNNHGLVAAIAVSITLAGCGSGVGDETVEVVVANSANVRDAATAEGSSVLETLHAGTELTGRWVMGKTNSSEQWLEFERDGEKVYIWARNLSEKTDSQYASKQLPTNETDNVPEEVLRTANPPQPALPRAAFACGGDGYRNGRIVFDPEKNKIYSGSIHDGKKMQSSLVKRDGEGWYVLFQGNVDQPSSEAYFYPAQLTLRQNSNYEPGGEEKSRSCYARIDRVKYECATAGDINKCMEIRDRAAWASDFAGSCSITAPRWQDFQCDDITQNYPAELSQIRRYPLYDF